MENRKLIAEAIEARDRAYTPYSKFKVGAALQCENGNIYTGCNIENAALSPTNCGERTAFFKAVSEGERKFKKIAIVGGLEDKGIVDYVFPCGVCRQVMMEFCNEDEFIIIVAKDEKDYKEFLLKELLPNGFGGDDLK